LTDGLSFGYRFPEAAKKREGRLANPMSVTMTLKLTKFIPLPRFRRDRRVGEYRLRRSSCSSDTTDMFRKRRQLHRTAASSPNKPCRGARPTPTHAIKTSRTGSQEAGSAHNPQERH